MFSISVIYSMKIQHFGTLISTSCDKIFFSSADIIIQYFIQLFNCIFLLKRRRSVLSFLRICHQSRFYCVSNVASFDLFYCMDFFFSVKQFNTALISAFQQMIMYKYKRVKNKAVVKQNDQE